MAQNARFLARHARCVPPGAMKAARLFVLFACGCGARTSLSQGVETTACPAAPPICVQSATDPCGAPTEVDATCEEAEKAWACPPLVWAK
jgi:hypothetical protein